MPFFELGRHGSAKYECAINVLGVGENSGVLSFICQSSELALAF
jgi:hypothetical protein